MRFARIVSVIPAATGLTAVAFAAWGFSKVDVIESALTMGHFFNNPQYGTTSADDWRFGFMNAMTLSFAFGALSIVAAAALFYRRLWGKYLWLGLVALAAAAAIPGLPHDHASWVWLAGCLAVLAISWFGLRNSNDQATAAP